MVFGVGAGGDFSSLGETTFVFAVVTDGVEDGVTADGTTAEVDDRFEPALCPDPLNRVSWECYVEGFAELSHHTTL